MSACLGEETTSLTAYKVLSHNFNSPALSLTNPLNVHCINKSRHELLMRRFLTAFMHFGAVTQQDSFNSYVHIEVNIIVWRQDDVRVYKPLLDVLFTCH